MAGLNITPAEHGGFIVMREAVYSDRGDSRWPPLFAGSLADCLDFMRAQLSTSPTTQDERA